MDLYTPEEIRALYDEYQRLRALNLPITKDFERRLRDASVGVKDYTRQLENNLNQLKNSGIGLAKAFNDGKSGASVYNDTLRSGADLLSAFLKALGPLGWVLGSLVKAGSEYVIAANEQSDALFNSYTNLNKLGVGLSDGVDGVYKLGQQLGYGTKELEKLATIIAKNAQDFAMLGGTAEQGTKRFGEVVDGMRGYELEFRKLGISIQDVNDGAAGYMRMQAQTGRGQNQDLASLSKGAREYIHQQQLIAKLTGQNAEMQMAADEEMLNNANFQVFQRELRQREQDALARGDKEEAARLNKQYNENVKLIRMLPKDQRKGAMDLMTGYVSASKEAEQFFRLAPEAASKIKSGQFEATAVADKASREAGSNMNRFSNSLGKVGQMDELFGSYSGMRDLELMTRKESLKEREETAKKELEDQKRIQGATAAYASVLVEQRRTRESLEDFINAGINPTTRAMSGLTSAAEKISGIPASAAGVPAPPSGTAAYPDTGGTAAKQPDSKVQEAPPKGSTKALLELIGKVEARGNYNILVGGRTEPRLSDMTIDEVLKFQYGMRGRGHESTAVGKYQIIRKTLEGLVRGGATNPNEKFSPATQDKLAVALLNQRGYQKFLAGKMTADSFADRIAMEWASFPMASGSSYYDKVGSNKALVDRGTVLSTLRGYEFGGIASGPESGYKTVLHGTEAVIPMNDDQSISVETQGMESSIKTQLEMMSQQSNQLNDLINIMRTRNQLSQKILRAYQN